MIISCLRAKMLMKMVEMCPWESWKHRRVRKMLMFLWAKRRDTGKCSIVAREVVRSIWAVRWPSHWRCLSTGILTLYARNYHYFVAFIQHFGVLIGSIQALLATHTHTHTPLFWAILAFCTLNTCWRSLTFSILTPNIHITLPIFLYLPLHSSCSGPSWFAHWPISKETSDLWKTGISSNWKPSNSTKSGYCLCLSNWTVMSPSCPSSLHHTLVGTCQSR